MISELQLRKSSVHPWILASGLNTRINVLPHMHEQQALSKWQTLDNSWHLIVGHIFGQILHPSTIKDSTLKNLPKNLLLSVLYSPSCSSRLRTHIPLKTALTEDHNYVICVSKEKLVSLVGRLRKEEFWGTWRVQGSPPTILHGKHHIPRANPSRSCAEGVPKATTLASCQAWTLGTCAGRH